MLPVLSRFYILMLWEGSIPFIFILICLNFIIILLGVQPGKYRVKTWEKRFDRENEENMIKNRCWSKIKNAFYFSDTSTKWILSFQCQVLWRAPKCFKIHVFGNVTGIILRWGPLTNFNLTQAFIAAGDWSVKYLHKRGKIESIQTMNVSSILK